MKPLPGERELLRTNGGTLVLTSCRVRLDQHEGGRSQVVSIMLHQVAACGLVTKSYPVVLLLAVTIALLAMAMSQYIAAIVAGGTLAAVYFLSRKAILSITSAGAAIEVASSGLSRRALVDFIDSLEEAKFMSAAATVVSP